MSTPFATNQLKSPSLTTFWKKGRRDFIPLFPPSSPPNRTYTCATLYISGGLSLYTYSNIVPPVQETFSRKDKRIREQQESWMVLGMVWMELPTWPEVNWAGRYHSWEGRRGKGFTLFSFWKEGGMDGVQKEKNREVKMNSFFFFFHPKSHKTKHPQIK